MAGDTGNPLEDSDIAPQFVALPSGGFLAVIANPTSAYNGSYTGFNMYLQTISATGVFGTPELVETTTNGSADNFLDPVVLSNGDVVIDLGGHYDVDSVFNPGTFEVIDPSQTPANIQTLVAMTPLFPSAVAPTVGTVSSTGADSPLQVAIPNGFAANTDNSDRAGVAGTYFSADNSGGVFAALQSGIYTGFGGYGTLDANLYAADFDPTAPPVVTAANIDVSGATGTGRDYKIGDTVTATWNDSASGDNNSATITGVTFDFSQFGGGTAVAATDVSNVWTASYTITAGSIDASNRNVAVTASDSAGPTTASGANNVTVDDKRPTVTAGNISLSGGTGAGGAFRIGDTVTATWNDSGTGDDNTDTINAGGVTMNFAQFGGGSAVVATNSGGVWTATYTITAGGIDTSNAHVAVTATDHAGNATTTASSAVTVDDEQPVVTAGNINVSGATGTNGFKIGDTVTATWNNTVSGDNNTDTINAGGVTFNFSQFGGSSAVTATNVGGIWTATDAIMAGGIDTSNAHVAVTATDHAGNATTAAGSAVAVDDIAPSVTAPNIIVSGATGTNGAFKIGDTVTASWNDTVSGDNNTDTINAGGVTVNFSQFGGGSAVVATDSGGVWTATYTIATGSIDTGNAHAAVAVTDHVGNTATTSGGAVTVDDITPTVSAIDTVGSSPNNASSESYTVTFSESVTGVDSSDFTAMTTGSVADTGIMVTPVSGSVYTVTVDGVTGDGTLGLNLNSSGTAIADAAGNAISGGFTGQTYTIEHTPPTVTSITALDASTNNASGDQFTVTFSEAVAGVAASDFALTTTNAPGGAPLTTGGVTSITTTDNINYTVTVGSVAGDGTLRLDLNASSTGVTDAAGNGDVAAFTSGQVYTIDHTPPTIAFGATPTFNGDEPTILSGTASSYGAGLASVQIYAGSVSNANRLGAATIGQGGTWSFTDNLGTGTYYPLIAVATDDAGNQSSAQATYGFEIGITGQPYTAAELLYAGGVVAGVQYYNADGSLYVGETIASDGSGGTDYTYSGGSSFNGLPYTSYTNDYNSSGQLIGQSLYDGATLYLSDTVKPDGSGGTDYTYSGGSSFNGLPYTSYTNDYNSSGQLIGQSLYDGATLYLSDTVKPDGSGGTDYTYSGGSSFNGLPYTSYTNDYNSSGQLIGQSLYDGATLYLSDTVKPDGSGAAN